MGQDFLEDLEGFAFEEDIDLDDIEEGDDDGDDDDGEQN